MHSFTAQACFPLPPWQLIDVLKNEDYVRSRFAHIEGVEVLDVECATERDEISATPRVSASRTTLLLTPGQNLFDAAPKSLRRLLPKQLRMCFEEKWQGEYNGEWKATLDGLTVKAEGRFLLERVPARPWEPPLLPRELLKLIGEESPHKAQAGSIYELPGLPDASFTYEPELDDQESPPPFNLEDLDGDLPLSEEEFAALPEKARASETGRDGWRSFRMVPEYPHTIKHVGGDVAIRFPLATPLEKKICAQMPLLSQIELVKVLSFLVLEH